MAHRPARLGRLAPAGAAREYQAAGERRVTAWCRVCATLLALAAVVASAGCDGGRNGGVAAADAALETAASTATAQAAPVPSSTTAPVAPSSTPTTGVTSTTAAPASTTTTEPMPGPGVKGPKVQALQDRLAELGYNPGPADGAFGASTGSAVMAFQKVEGLSADGVAGPETLGRLDSPRGAVPSGGATRIEIDLGRQVLFVVGTGRTRIFNTSTGNGEAFTWPDGTPALAYTPTGSFAVYYRYDGMFEGVLGNMYRPMYFHGDWAVHGSGYVPAYPASHGCARVSNADQDWIWANVPTGTPVVVR